MSPKYACVLIVGALILTACVPGHAARWGQWHNSLKPQGQPAGQLTLALAGQTDYVIVVPDSATTQEQKAAEELSLWLGEMTGADFPIVSDSQPAQDKEISVGRTSRLAATNLAVPSEKLAEGYKIAVAGEKLYLMGGERVGPLYAVSALLEEDLGCRWYAPDANRVLKRPTVRFYPVARTYIPTVEVRNPRQASTRDGMWSLRNKVNGAHSDIPEDWGGTYNYAIWVHSFNALVPPSKYFEEHPEYYSELDGKRRPRQLCTTNPDIVAIAAENALKRLREHPEAEMISISANDGGGFCTCEECRALDAREGTHAASLLHFVNQVAEIIEKEFPDVWVTTLAYTWHAPPPQTIQPRKNVAMRFCTDTCMWPRPFVSIADDEGPPPDWPGYWDVTGGREHLSSRRFFHGWASMQPQPRIHIWDYPVNYSHYVAPMPNIPVIADNIRFFADGGAKALMEQSPMSFGAERGEMRAWVYSKLMWDPSRDVHELMHDFIWGYYGQAAPAIQQYNDLLQQRYERFDLTKLERIRYPMDSEFLKHGFVQQANAIFDRAEESAESEEILRRVEVARVPVMYVELSQLHIQLTETGELPDRAHFEALVDQFVDLTNRCGITVVGDHGNTVTKWTTTLREAIAQSEG